MKRRFNDSELREMARELGASPEAVRRLVGSLPVAAPKSQPPQDDPVGPDAKAYGGVALQLALRIEELRAGQQGPNPGEQRALVNVLREYRNACPRIFRWIASGDFNPKRIPETVSRGELVHASRTAGRLRAKWIRSMKE